MDVTSGTLATLLFMLLAAVVIWLVRRYYQRHTYEPIKPFKRKDIMINIGWALLLRVIVIGMSFLMMAITGQAQTENDKALLGNFQGAKPSPDQLGQAFPVIVFALTLTFVAPYLEELIYRGIFKETLFKRSSFGYHLFYPHLFCFPTWYFKLGCGLNVYHNGDGVLSRLSSSS